MVIHMSSLSFLEKCQACLQELEVDDLDSDVELNNNIEDKTERLSENACKISAVGADEKGRHLVLFW
jgi:hypothetical protein